jgi:hypothetical protein
MNGIKEKLTELIKKKYKVMSNLGFQEIEMLLNENPDSHLSLTKICKEINKRINYNEYTITRNTVYKGFKYFDYKFKKPCKTNFNGECFSIDKMKELLLLKLLYYYEENYLVIYLD